MRRTAWLLLLTPAFCFGDEVHLQGGAVFTGRIVEQTETTVSVDIGNGVVGVPMARVERIEKKRSALDDYDAKVAHLGADDAAGWRNLGRWAAEKGLSAQAGQAYQQVLAIAPDDPEARQALGFIQVDGRWLAEEDAYRAQGYVKYDGEWMTPAEARMAQAAAESEMARQQAERRAADAENAAHEAEQRAQEAEQRAQEAQDAQEQQYNQPVYWGGWGYGMNYWPTPTRPNLPNYKPPAVVKPSAPGHRYKIP